MAELIDYYQVLRVPPDADLTGIQNAYSRLSREFASRLAQDEIRRKEMQQLNQAYEVLADPQMRVEYDRAFFADEYADLDHRWRRAIMRQRFNKWTIGGVLGGVVLVEAALVAFFGYSNTGTVTGAIGSVVGDFTDGVKWAWSYVEDANASLGNPVEWFEELAGAIKDAAS